MTQASLFPRFHVTQPPGAGYSVLWCDDRVIAQGSEATLQLNPMYWLLTRYRASLDAQEGPPRCIIK